MKVLYCAGEQAKVTLDILARLDEDEPIRLLDDNPKRHGDFLCGYEILGGKKHLDNLNPDRDSLLVTLGRIDGDRVEIADTIRDAGFSLFSVVDPETTVSDTAVIGDGTVINAQTYIGPNADLDELVLVDSTVNVSHDVYVAQGATVAPNVTLTGGVRVGERAYIGAGATVLDHRRIGADAIVGAGSVVTEDVPPNATVVGVPAETIEFRTVEDDD